MKEQCLLQLRTVNNSNLVTEVFTLTSFVAVIKMKEKKSKVGHCRNCLQWHFKRPWIRVSVPQLTGRDPLE